MNLTINEEIMMLTSAIEKKLGKIESEIVIDLRLRKENKIKSIYSSLAIEQNSLSIEQITAIINGQQVLGAEKEIQEVKNAYTIYNQFDQLDSTAPKDLLYAHSILTSNIINSNGHYRNSDVGIFTEGGQVVHMGARPEFVPELIAKLFEDINKSVLSPIIKACLFHYELELIHPFEDGNGRMGRLWQNLILSKYSTVFEFLTIETLIYENQQKYYNKLQESDYEGEASIFVSFMLELINNTLSSFTHSRIIELNAVELESYNKLIVFIEDNNKITTSEFSSLIKKAPATARRYIAKYVQLDLLESHGENKNRFYTI